MLSQNEHPRNQKPASQNKFFSVFQGFSRVKAFFFSGETNTGFTRQAGDFLS